MCCDSSSPPDPRITPCPTCRQHGPWHDGAHAPFCSRRCQLLDLGRWLDEEHLIVSPLPPTDPGEERTP